jgi:hypothetical protein
MQTEDTCHAALNALWTHFSSFYHPTINKPAKEAMRWNDATHLHAPSHLEAFECLAVEARVGHSMSSGSSATLLQPLAHAATHAHEESRVAIAD